MRSCGDLTRNQNSTTKLLTTFSNVQTTIDSQKRGILNGLSNYYTLETINAQNTEISSFILQSLSDATSILQSQGLVQSFSIDTAPT
jgi:hypothetical protein